MSEILASQYEVNFKKVLRLRAHISPTVRRTDDCCTPIEPQFNLVVTIFYQSSIRLSFLKKKFQNVKNVTKFFDFFLIFFGKKFHEFFYILKFFLRKHNLGYFCEKKHKNQIKFGFQRCAAVLYQAYGKRYMCSQTQNFPICTQRTSKMISLVNQLRHWVFACTYFSS